MWHINLAHLYIRLYLQVSSRGGFPVMERGQTIHNHYYNNNVCTPFKGSFTKIEHNINTRNNGCSLKLPKAKLEFGRRSFAFQGALVYNTLPRHLRTVNSRFLFKSNLKQFFQ